MRQLAVIRDIHFGVGDRGRVCMWFSAFVSESSTALQVLSVEQAVDLLQRHGVDNTSRLEGKTVWVEVDDRMIKYLEPAKL